MKTRPLNAGFTLIEVVVVIAIVIALTGIVVGLSGYVQNQGAKARSRGEISMLRNAAVAYKGDNGSFPQNDDTDELSPYEHFDATTSKYVDANLHLYRELTGDREPKEKPDYQYTSEEEKEAKRYLTNFEQRILSLEKDSQTGKIKRVKFIQDAWGNPYGYSTRALSEELEYQKKVRAGKDEARKTGEELGGFNTAEFDLWSTAGSKRSSTPSQGSERELEWGKWIKNW